jgi:hypothetical protein
VRRYRYVGPEEIRQSVEGQPPGACIRTLGDLERALAALAPAGEPCTFVIDVDGVLRLADRHSEHVACAGGGEVLAAGEIAFARRWNVARVSNQSTGYCPEPSSFAAVARALDAIGVRRGEAYDDALIFRRCPSCRERNVVKDEVFVCDLCGAELPAEWSFDF